MARPVPANVNPRLLEWARQEGGFSVEAVAKRVGVPPARVEEWERGEKQPTVRQTLKIAGLFRRPFGVFFLAAPPVTEPLAADYRRLPGVKPGAESPEFRLAIRLMVQRRDLALELGSDGFPTFTLTARLSEGAEAVSARVRSALAIPIETQTSWKDEWMAWREWRSAVESIGVLVFQFPSVPLAEVRGVALPHFPVPAVGINSRESAPAARAFTLVHEVVHLALSRAQEEDVALREKRNDTQWLEVERFAEEVTSHVLVPAAALDATLVVNRPSAWDVPAVRALARRFRITPRAMATRLRASGHMSWATYTSWTAAWDKVVAAIPPKKGGFATPVEKTLGRAGRPLTQLVLEALDANRITAVDASRYLNLRFDHFDTLRTELGHQSLGALAE